ncbi:hypothetical protein QW060_19545 [Myroides ceti]|uniref:Uncharacterized protein n=1 Tax=Paenimyroides ceti TaxID=395087 RepID=A0ABT8CZP1_9FLAO|nr:hypothetical protein [Paenimyroides ceti]MDN3709221.1 hypothetical protein [Paenimyroides ceti]
MNCWEPHLNYNTSLGYIGNFGGFINGGFFINASNIAFMDYKHFYEMKPL